MIAFPLLPALPPMVLHADGVALQFCKVVFPPVRYQAPYYHFRILAGTRDVGHINLRVGDSEHVLRVVGHVGYGIRKKERGKGYALRACRALASFARAILGEVYITCDPANHASRKTLERLVGGKSGEAVTVPRMDPHYHRGARIKLRFRWMP